MGREFTPEAWGKIYDDYSVAMRRCERCGFVFFDPSLAGNEVFYRQLEHTEYFCQARPEFTRTLEFTCGKGIRRTLDVGCGSGAFLDLAKKAGCQTFGLELNSAAAEKARAKGHTIYGRLLNELDRDQTSGGFDLITLFQVLEHLPDPVATLKDAAALLNPGGYISVAVPSEEGMCRLAPWDPYNWPPHHLSRWRRADFEQLAGAAHLELVQSGGDVLLGSGIEQLWQLHNRLACVLGKRGRWGGETLPRLVSLVYRKTGMKFLFPRRGRSIYAYFCRE